MAQRNAPVPKDQRIEFRIGINLGDVIVEGDDIYGNGVNVAARLEAIADAGGICVSARVQEDTAGGLDLSFEDLGEKNLKNIARAVRVYAVRLAAKEHTPTTGTMEGVSALAVPDKPSIAVLPFQNMSSDPEQEYFVDGMVEEIITALSRIRWLFVTARNSTLTYKGQAIDVKQVGRELGVRYVLEGSVRKGGNRVRITGQLIDTLTGTHLWADRFDGLIEDVFELQDKIALSVAGVIEPTLRAAETRRAIERGRTNPTSYDLYLRALPLLSGMSKDDILEGVKLLENAIAIDPHYGPSLVFASIFHMRLAGDGWSDDPRGSGQRAVTLARRALEAAADDPVVLANAAFALGLLGEDVFTMIAVTERALALNPSYARGWYISGVLQVLAGEGDLAIKHFQNSLSLSPRDYLGAAALNIGTAHFLCRRFEQAAENFRLAIQRSPAWPWPYRFLASCYGYMGRRDEAEQVISQLHATGAEVWPDNLYLPGFERALSEMFRSGLQLVRSENA